MRPLRKRHLLQIVHSGTSPGRCIRVSPGWDFNGPSPRPLDVPTDAPYNEANQLFGENYRVPLDLKSSLNLPKTDFPMKANLPQNEPKMLARWEQMDLYGRIRKARAGATPYVLHDGPPYANGALHLGHALGACLQDFIVKSKTMAGFDAPFVP